MRRVVCVLIFLLATGPFEKAVTASAATTRAAGPSSDCTSLLRSSTEAEPNGFGLNKSETPLKSVDALSFPTVSQRIIAHPLVEIYLRRHAIAPSDITQFLSRPEQRPIQNQIWSLERMLTQMRSPRDATPSPDALFVEDEIMQRQLERILKVQEPNSGPSLSAQRILQNEELEELGLWDRMKACVAQQSATETAKDFGQFRMTSFLSSQANLTLGYLSAGGLTNFNTMDFLTRSVNMGATNLVQSHFLGNTRNLSFGKRVTQMSFVQMGQNTFDISLYAFQPFQYIPGVSQQPAPSRAQIMHRLLFNSLWSVQSIPKNIMFQEFISGMQCLAKLSGSKWVTLSPAVIQFGNSYLNSYLYFKAYNAYQGAIDHQK